LTETETLTIDTRSIALLDDARSELLAGAHRCAERPTRCRVLSLPGQIGNIDDVVLEVALQYGAKRETADDPWAWVNGSTMVISSAMPDQGEHPGFDPLPNDDK